MSSKKREEDGTSFRNDCSMMMKMVDHKVLSIGPRPHGLPSLPPSSPTSLQSKLRKSMRSTFKRKKKDNIDGQRVCLKVHCSQVRPECNHRVLPITLRTTASDVKHALLMHVPPVEASQYVLIYTEGDIYKDSSDVSLSSLPRKPSSNWWRKSFSKGNSKKWNQGGTFAAKPVIGIPSHTVRVLEDDEMIYLRGYHIKDGGLHLVKESTLYGRRDPPHPYNAPLPDVEEQHTYIQDISIECDEHDDLFEDDDNDDDDCAPMVRCKVGSSVFLVKPLRRPRHDMSALAFPLDNYLVRQEVNCSID
eukprot:m.124146 g.124146  ORF g.124146 m.124146 type:complete len:304 (-) comp9422_c2_seq1:466-1377(-)